MADYSQQWRVYRRLRNLALGVSISILFLGMMSVLFGPLDSNRLGLILALSIGGIGAFSAAIVTAVRVNAWRCPRCGRSFVSKWWSKFAVFFATDCANCGLRKFTNG
jgi:hypothetical protein